MAEMTHRERVVAARTLQAERLPDRPAPANAALTSAETRRFYALFYHVDLSDEALAAAADSTRGRDLLQRYWAQQRVAELAMLPKKNAAEIGQRESPKSTPRNRARSRGLNSSQRV